MLKHQTLIVITLLLIPYSVFSSVSAGCKNSDCASCHTLSKDEATEILKKTGGVVRSVKQAPVKGMFELLMEKDGKQGLVYIDYSKKYLVQGFSVDLATLTTVAAHATELPKPYNPESIDIRGIPVKNALLLGNPKGFRKAYLFTEPDCNYCRKMHHEVKRLVKIMPDLAVYVMLYPLPSHPEAYDKSRVIVTFGKVELLDKAFAGDPLPSVGALDGIEKMNEIINFARRNGIIAAPTLVMDDGRVLTGYKTAEEIMGILSGSGTDKRGGDNEN